jgi:hypothetical protein
MDLRRVTFSAFLVLWAVAPGAQESLAPLEKKVEVLRGLTFRRPVAAQFVGSEGMMKVVRGELDRAYPPSEWPKVEKTLKVFGLIPPKMNLRAVMEGMLEDQVAGLYDPRGKKLYVNKDPLEGSDMLEGLGLGDLKLQDAYLVHELDHALTDQRFDLEALPLDDLSNEDRADAARCVVEGDATWVMLRYLYDILKVPPEQRESLGNMMAALGMGKELMGSAYPAYLEENLLTAYLAGTDLVKRAYDRGGFDGVNRLYRHPPQSMEQVLHPDKYFSQSDPPLAALASLPKAWREAGWRQVARGVWGELNTRIILKEWGVPEEKAERAAEGWGGDSYAVAEGEGGAGFVWTTLWDSERDAGEFHAALGALSGITVRRERNQVTVTKGGPKDGGETAAVPASGPLRDPGALCELTTGRKRCVQW